MFTQKPKTLIYKVTKKYKLNVYYDNGNNNINIQKDCLISDGNYAVTYS